MTATIKPVWVVVPVEIHTETNTVYGPAVRGLASSDTLKEAEQELSRR